MPSRIRDGIYGDEKYRHQSATVARSSRDIVVLNGDNLKMKPLHLRPEGRDAICHVSWRIPNVYPKSRGRSG